MTDLAFNFCEHNAKSNSKSENAYNSGSESDSEEKEEESLECELCGKVCDDFDSYIEHSGMGDCVENCNHRTFKEEEDLKKHMENHCLQCGKEFSTVNALKSHQKRCS